MNRKVTINVKQIEFHRNGIAGEGFYAILFTSDSDGMGGVEGDSLFVATLFDEPGYCAVLRVPDLSEADKGVTFGINSWRGDVFEDELRQAVKNQKTTNRIGPFSVPVL